MSRTVGDYLIGQACFDAGRTIGEGTFGKVKAATHLPTHEQVAIKVLEKNKICQVDDVERVSRQIHILKLIRHPNIVHLYEIIETPKQLFLVMEYMEGGQLFQEIVRQRRIPQKEACRIFHQLLDAVECMHRAGVAHRDLKPQNILLDFNRGVRVVDFGLSNTYKAGQSLKTPCGSPCYAAPQMIRGQEYGGVGVDVWSCGVVLFAMLNGYLPFQDPDTPTLYKKILSGAYSLHPCVGDSAKQLIQQILESNPLKRLSLPQIRKHPFMQLHTHKRAVKSLIEIDPHVLQQVTSYEKEYVRKCVMANRHNAATTAYYLCLKRHLRKDLDKENTVENKGRKSCIYTQNTNVTLLNVICEKRANSSFSKQRKGNKSVEKGKPTQKQPQNKINKRYKERFNQSLLSKSKQKVKVVKQPRTRINSSINGQQSKRTNDTSLFEENRRNLRRL